MAVSILEFIEQVVISELAPEAEEDEIFGQWLDPKQRKLGVTEPNTPEEDGAVQALRSFMGFANNPSRLSANNGHYAKMFLDLMKRHKYAPVLDPDVSYVYRGLNFEDTGPYVDFFSTHPVESFTLYDVNDKEIDIQGRTLMQCLQEKNYHMIEGRLAPFSLKPKPNTLVQSWSEELSIACGFANPMGRGGVVLKANVESNNFFGKPGELGNLAGSGNPELETISVGPVQTMGGMFVISAVFIDEVWFQDAIQDLER